MEEPDLSQSDPTQNGQFFANYLHEARSAALEALTDVPPRFVPVAMGALIEARLTEMLTLRLVEGKVGAKLAKKPYAERVNLCHAVGLIDEEHMEVLLRMGPIRNHFAHNPNAKITDQKIRGDMDFIVKVVAKGAKSLEGYEEMNDSDIEKEWQEVVAKSPSQALMVLRVAFGNVITYLAASEFLLTKPRLRRIKSVWP